MGLRDTFSSLRKHAPKRIELATSSGEKSFYRYAEQALSILEANEDIDSILPILEPVPPPAELAEGEEPPAPADPREVKSSLEVLGDFLRGCANVDIRKRADLINSSKFDAMFPPSEDTDAIEIRRGLFLLTINRLGDVGLRIVNDQLKRVATGK
jgi:hypothetical protein